MASIAEDHAHASGYNLVLYNTHSDLDRETNYIHTARQRWVDGLLFVSTRDYLGGLTTLQKAGIPLVIIDRIPKGYDGPSVTLDNFKAGRLVAEHLLNLGHVYTSQITGPLDLRLSHERKQGFHEVVRERGLELGPCAAADDNWSCESGYLAMLSLLQAHPQPTAVFAANDRVAIGAMRAIIEAGLRIPDDISIVGVDDIEMSAYCNPPLTTLRQSLVGVATLGIEILLDILEGKQPQESRIVLDPTLVVRGSTSQPGANRAQNHSDRRQSL